MNMQGTYVAPLGAAIASDCGPIRAARSKCAMAVTAPSSRRRKDAVAPSFHFDETSLGTIQLPGYSTHESSPGRHPVQSETGCAQPRTTTSIGLPNARIRFIPHVQESEDRK